MTKILFFLCAFIFLFGSCRPAEDFIVQGLAPVYRDFTDFSDFIRTEPREFNNISNLVNVGDYIFLTEMKQGIHVIDNSDPTNPVTVHFWQIFGCDQFTIEGNTLFVGNSRHLIVIDISDFLNIEVKSYVSDFYNYEPFINRPDSDYTGFFICVDHNLGFVTDWENQELVNPLCEAF